MKFTGFCKRTAVFGLISPVSAVNVRVPRDLLAVGKIPGKSQYRKSEMKNPETIPPVALRLSGACRFPVLPLYAKNYECGGPVRPQRRGIRQERSGQHDPPPRPAGLPPQQYPGLVCGGRPVHRYPPGRSISRTATWPSAGLSVPTALRWPRWSIR